MTDEIPLGRTVSYPDRYTPDLLFAVPRAEHRTAIGLGDTLPFQGVDIWKKRSAETRPSLELIPRSSGQTSSRRL